MRAGGTTAMKNLAAVLAMLPGGDPASAITALEEHEPRLGHGEKMQARFLLFRAMNGSAQREKAHRLLCHLRDRGR
jgi:hypothetical protein